MTNPTTPQEVHAAFIDAVSSMGHIPGITNVYEAIAPDWDDLSDAQQAMFVEMAEKLNSRVEQKADISVSTPLLAVNSRRRQVVLYNETDSPRYINSTDVPEE